MVRQFLTVGLLAALVGLATPPPARAQAPTIDTGSLSPGGISSSLGPQPGSNANQLGNTPGGGAGVLSGGGSSAPISGRAGPTGPHVPSSVSNPMTAVGPNNQPAGITAPQPTATLSAPSYGSYEIPAGGDDEGPADGLTLDQAIDVLIKNNLDLRSKSYEIPQARADILNAGLRANPVFYGDGQLVPYGRYNRDRPGGQTQYDVNVSYPFDLSRKRQARTLYATRALRVIEAQYQDAVRNSIDSLYVAFVNVLSARQTLRYSQASVRGLTRLFDVTNELYVRDQGTKADVDRVKTQLGAAEVGLIDAEENLRKSNRDLGTLLNIPADRTESIRVRGSIQVPTPELPPPDELIRMSLALRPDVVSFRLGVRTAEANVRLQLANRFTDVYVLYQPYTFQDNSPFGLKSPTSWALGVTVPLPVYNRNQGGIARAKLNVTQSLIEMEQIERQTTNDVQQALNEYKVTARMVAQIRNDLQPAAMRVRDTTYRLYRGGEINLVAYLIAQREYQDNLKQFLDTLVRHRRSMLALNTAVGQRVFP